MTKQNVTKQRRRLKKGRVVSFLCFFGVIFQKIGQKGRPGRQEPPRSISFDETSRMVSVWGRRRKVIFWFLFDLDKSLHDLVENYAKFARKTRHRQRAKLAAALRAAANFDRRGCRVFPRIFRVISAYNIV